MQRFLALVTDGTSAPSDVLTFTVAEDQDPRVVAEVTAAEAGYTVESVWMPLPEVPAR